MEILGFDWDDGNRQKCKSHDMSLDEVESVFINQPMVSPNMKHDADEERYHAIGMTTAGRYAYVVFTIRQNPEGKLIRPISARFMHKKEIAHYEKQIKK
jgi:uncharacterized DUF497 family protein